MEVGKDFNKILFEEILTGVSKSINQINENLLSYDDAMFDSVMNYYSEAMKQSIIENIDSQVIASKKTRDAYVAAQEQFPLL